MTEIVFCLGVIVAMIGISVLTGLGLLLVFPARWLLRGRLESLLAWVFIGLGWWMLAFGWLTYMGLSTRQLRWPLLASGLIFSVAGLWKLRGALSALRRSLRKRRTECIVLAATCVLSLVGVLYRAQLFQWVNPFNDNMIYVSLATYLQDHSFNAFSAPAVDRQDAVTWYVNNEQAKASGWARLGCSHYSMLDGPRCAVATWPLMGSGILLNLAGVYLLHAGRPTWAGDRRRESSCLPPPWARRFRRR